jgi:aldose 1-epimerase
MQNEFVLKHGDQRVTVGARGASLRTYRRGDWSVIWGYEGDQNKKAGQGDVLMPFPSRLKDGRYTFGGQTHQLELNDKEGPNAIHGFLRDVIWTPADVTATAVTFQTHISPTSFRGYPFALDVAVTYELGPRGLRTSFAMTNVGPGPAPAGAGFHPYFTVDDHPIDRAEAAFPAAEYLEFQNLVPTGRVLSVSETPLDYRALKPIGNTRFNFCFCRLERDADGVATAVIRQSSGSRRITLRFDRSFNYLVVYSGEAIPAPDTRRAFAIEPLTCATDAFNHPEWGLSVLAPGEILRGSFEIEPTD